jgi:hypothetical protein
MCCDCDVMMRTDRLSRVTYLNFKLSLYHTAEIIGFAEVVFTELDVNCDSFLL